MITRISSDRTWIVPDWLARRELMVVSGRNAITNQSDAGKTFLCHWLCVRLANGAHVYGFGAPLRTSVLYLSFQDRDDELSRKKYHAIDELTEDSRHTDGRYLYSMALRATSSREALRAIDDIKPQVLVIDAIDCVEPDIVKSLVEVAIQKNGAAVIVVSSQSRSWDEWNALFGRIVSVSVACTKNKVGRIEVSVRRDSTPLCHFMEFSALDHGELRLVRKTASAGWFEKPKGARAGLSKVTSRKRWRILEAARFRCVACGTSASEVELHVDHIVPVSRGGSSDESNLQALCRVCNLGKGNLMPSAMTVD